MAHGAAQVSHANEQLMRITTAFLVLAWVFVSLRVWTRTFILSNFGWDDATMIFAAMIFTLFCSSLLYVGANGGGTHVVSFEQFNQLSKWVLVGYTSYIATMVTIKISVGLYFARIVVEKWHFKFIYGVVGVNLVSSIAAFFYTIFRCGTNMDEYALQQVVGNCGTVPFDRFMAYQIAFVTTLTDLAFVVLPIVLLWNAHMDRRSKMSVGFVLSLATLGSICSMIRFKYVGGLIYVEDFFFNSISIGIWSAIEAGAGIMAACGATLRPLVKGIVGKAATMKSKSGGSKGLSKIQSNSQIGSRPKPGDTGNSQWSDTLVTSGSKSGGSISDKPGFLETLAARSEDDIEMMSQASHGRRGSQDGILAGDVEAGRPGPGPEAEKVDRGEAA